MTEHRGGAGNFAEDRQKLLTLVVKAANIVAVILKRSTKSIRSREKGGQNSHGGGRKSDS